ncbi:multidrug transporter MatE [Lachnospiraceae bacterium]|uniref:MATE family efflux transporter n=1 Tax=Extibacter sp. GGCC_0201 TaxID=2731209 RepID=UPI001AA10CE8|nr:MATE family efflux transporter [Extibacter sp. GGCC_0201]MBO1720768.1 MATE family efflux transporter [Extibacter sp. GGCC_0201]BDF33292.1 multidrug transporter MatE [Lachnospiraceae bacterium]BDF37296.1 multidrug transporter MatE [Lachnospiraceae bacterium]
MNQNANEYLAREPVGRLMLKFSVPCILSLLVSALYNIVDQIFIGRGVGYLGNGATNVVFPITVIALALALLIGDGCAAYLSICQGMKNEERAHKCVGNAVVMSTAAGLLLTAAFLLLKEPMLAWFGATENNIAYAEEYFESLVIGIPFFLFANAMNSIIRADGSPQFAMLSTLAGCIINVVLDPIAIFVLHWGMMGAAVATVAGQAVSALLAVCYLLHTKSFRLRKSSFRPRAGLFRHMLPLGVSSFLTQVSIVVIMIVMNNVLVTYGARSKYGADIPLTVVGIVMKVFQIVISVVVGIAAGAQPIVGYNYGAGQYGRVKEIFKKMMLAEFVTGLISCIGFEFFPLKIIGIFGSENGLYNEFAVLSFRVFLGMIVLCCLQKAASIFLQSLGKPLLSMSLSLLREFVLSVPLALILPGLFGVTGALYSAPAADIVSFAAAVLCIAHVFKEMKTEKKKLEEKKLEEPLKTSVCLSILE